MNMAGLIDLAPQPEEVSPGRPAASPSVASPAGEHRGEHGCHLGAAPVSSLAGRVTATRPRPPRVAGPGCLGLRTWTIGTSVVVSVAGEVDLATSDQLAEALGAALSGALSGASGVICEMSGVSFLGSPGLAVLMAARQRAVDGGVRFDVVCPQPLPRRVIALVGLEAALGLRDSPWDAAEAQARRADGPAPAVDGLGA